MRALHSKLILTFLLALAVTATHAQSNARKELERKKDKLVKEISALQQQLDQTKKNKSLSLEQVKALRDKIQARESLIGNYASQINLLDNDIVQTKHTITNQQTRLKDLQDRYARMVAYAYKHQSALDDWVFVLSAPSFNDAWQRLKYLRRYAAYRRAQAGSIREAVAGLTHRQTQLVQTKVQKEQLLNDQQAQRNQLAAEKQQQDQLAKTYSQQEKKLRADLANKKSEQDKLNKKIEAAIRKEIEAAAKASTKSSSKTKSKTKSEPEAHTAASDAAALTLTPEARALSNNFASNQGKFPWPVEQGNITEGFGVHAHPTLANVTTKNNGVDIRVPAGAGVRAVFRGKVVSILTNPIYHKAVIVRHGEYFTVYSNLDAVSVSVGDDVNTKQSIGKAHTDSDTGQTTTHFEVWKGTTFMNPENWLSHK